MKTPRLILALLALTFALASQSPGTAFAQADTKKYSAKLISPRAGQVLSPGQVVRIEWTANFPNVDLTMCETEILLSLDGGKTIYMFITEFSVSRRCNISIGPSRIRPPTQRCWTFASGV